MKGLLVKDLCLLKEQRQTMILLVLWLLLLALDVSFFGEVSFMLGFLSFLGAIVAISTISYDESDNGCPFLFTLPVSRRCYAAEKYMFTLCLVNVLWGVGLAGGLFKATFGSGGLPPQAVVTAAWMLVYVYALIALMIPIYLKFGAEKARVILILFLLALFAIIGGIFNTLPLEGGVRDLCTWLFALPEPALLAVSFGVSVAALLFSYAISVKILNNKEF